MHLSIDMICYTHNFTFNCTEDIMKITRFIVIASAILLCGCVSQQYLSYRNSVISNPELPESIRQQIISKQISMGMTKEHVIASWGEPCWICYGTRKSSSGDMWEYNVFGAGSYGAGGGTYLFFDNNGILRHWSN